MSFEVRRSVETGSILRVDRQRESHPHVPWASHRNDASEAPDFTQGRPCVDERFEFEQSVAIAKRCRRQNLLWRQAVS